MGIESIPIVFSFKADSAFHTVFHVMGVFKTAIRTELTQPFKGIYDCRNVFFIEEMLFPAWNDKQNGKAGLRNAAAIFHI